MGTHCYIGTRDTDQPHLVRARYVHFDGNPPVIVPTLQHLWAHTARRDTAALITAVLAEDWDSLDPNVTASSPALLPDQHPVAGVGMALRFGGPDAVEPVTVFPLAQACDLDAQWIYLIDPATSTVAVHTSDGDLIATHPLAA